MSHRAFCSFLLSIVVFLGCDFTFLSVARSAEPVKSFYEAANVQGGLVVHIGCDDGKSTAAFRANNRYIVQGLDTDADKVAAANRYFFEKGLSGAVTADVFDGRSLPYADNLVRLVIADANSGVPTAEIARVLAPGGVAMIRNGDVWDRSTKPWSDDIDQWTHHLHGPDNNAVAQDTVVGPPRRMQWQSPSLWSRSHEHISSFAAMVTAGGRTFYVFDESVPGVTRVVPEKWKLYARDSHNGVLLWERSLDDWNSGVVGGKALRSTSPIVQRAIVATNDILYTTDGHRGPIALLDAATGRTLRTIEGTEGTDEIVLSDGILYLRIRGEAYTGIVAADPKSGKILWRHDERTYLPMSLAVAGGRAVYSNRQQLVCLDIENGEKLWAVETPELKIYSGDEGPTVVISDDKVLGCRGSVLECHDLATGQLQWKAKHGGGTLRGADLFVIDGVAWCNGSGGVAGYDLQTGEQVSSINSSSVFSAGHHLRCYRSKATTKYILSPIRGVEFLSIESDDEHCQNDWTRGPCRYGVMPAGGLLYVPPSQCFCYPGALMNGLNAYSPASDEEMEEIGAAAAKLDGRLQQGPAFDCGGIHNNSEGSTTDWPMYRRTSDRHGSTPAKVEGKLTPSWRIEIGGRLTPPVMADDAVYLAAKDSCTLYSLDIADGEERWHYTTGGQIDSPPLVLGDRVLFGSADGWAYCVSAADGRLIWRFRAAPTDRKIVVDDRVESPWKVHGSPLLRDGLVYFTAGRSSFLDGGIFLYALDPADGSVIHQGRIDTWSPTREDKNGKPFLPAFHIEGTRTDLLVSEGDYIYMGQIKLTPSLELVDSPYRPGVEDFVEDRGATDAFGPIVKGRFVEENATYDFVDKDVVKTYPQQAKRWFRRGHMGARTVGKHLITTGGFLDDTYWHRIFWMYGDTWPGFYIANVASKSGQLLVIGPDKTYGVQCYPQRVVLSPMFTPGEKGYLLFADANDNEPVLDDRDWGRDKGMGFSRSAPPKWFAWIPVRIRAMTLADDRLFIAGPPDFVDPSDPLKTFEDRSDAIFRSYDAETGEQTDELTLDVTPVFDGMIAVPGRVLISLSDGSIVCMEGKE